MQATSDGAFVEPEPFREALELVDAVLPADVPFHVHFSDIAFSKATNERGEPGGNERLHLPYGEGTLRAEPLRVALAAFERPATVISESPDEASSQAIRVALRA
jgi:endonuclease IV